jgi:hypothetical protein
MRIPHEGSQIPRIYYNTRTPRNRPEEGHRGKGIERTKDRERSVIIPRISQLL